MGNECALSRPLILLVIALILIGAGFYAFKGEKSASTTFKEVKVARGELNINVLSTGVVQPENRLEIKPPIAGRIEEILVKEGDIVKTGQILAWMSSTERAGLLDAARSKGEAELKRWQEYYKPTPIMAPIDGTIILRSVEPGQTFTNADAVLVMSDRLSVKAQVDETDIAQITLNQRSEVTLDAYPDKIIPAYVLQIAFDAKTVNNVTTYEVDVLPEETPAFMRSGMTANINFKVAGKKEVLLVPSEAVKIVNGHSMLLLKSERGGAQTQIETGLSDGKFTEVLSGADEGAIVLVPQLRTEANKSTSPFSPFGGGRRSH